MKKTVFLLFILAGLFMAGCNQKALVKDIDGTWHVQNYAVNGADQTYWFDTTYSGFTWTFSGSSNFSKSYQKILKYTLYNRDTVAHYDTATHTLVIDSITISQAVVPTSVPVYIQGQWYLTNGNQYLQTQDSINGDQQYQILAHSRNSLHLLDGNKDYYLSK